MARFRGWNCFEAGCNRCFEDDPKKLRWEKRLEENPRPASPPVFSSRTHSFQAEVPSLCQGAHESPLITINHQGAHESHEYHESRCSPAVTPLDRTPGIWIYHEIPDRLGQDTVTVPFPTRGWAWDSSTTHFEKLQHTWAWENNYVDLGLFEYWNHLYNCTTWWHVAPYPLNGNSHLSVYCVHRATTQKNQQCVGLIPDPKFAWRGCMKVLTLLDSVHAIGIGQTWRHRVAFFMQSLLLLGLISHIRVAHHWKIPDIYIYIWISSGWLREHLQESLSPNLCYCSVLEELSPHFCAWIIFSLSIYKKKHISQFGYPLVN